MTVQYRHEIEEYDNLIAHASRENQLAYENGMRHYEQFVDGEIDRTELRATLDYANELKQALKDTVAKKVAFEKQDQILRKLLSVRDKGLPLSDIMGCIDKITTCSGKSIAVKWAIES